jgi:hypothetical protein
MPGADLEREFKALQTYPERCFGEPACERWLHLCSSMNTYRAPPAMFWVDKERKWELVSTLQKAIRRADRLTAIKAISGFAMMPAEYAYLWKRMCVIAAEDVGPADDILATFVVACSTVFQPQKTGAENHRLICFLAESMCDLPNRSRIYCSYSAIEPGVIHSDLPELSPTDLAIVAAIRETRAAVQVPKSAWRAWQKRNDWRTEGLLRFVGLMLPMQMQVIDTPLPTNAMLFDLPGYCYDVHTRLGLQVLQQLVRGARGAEGIRDFFRHTKIENAHRALGEVLFLLEGARIEGELMYAPLRSLEERFIAHKLKIPAERWRELGVLLGQALADGVVDRVRNDVLQRFYAQGNLRLIAQNEVGGEKATN